MTDFEVGRYALRTFKSKVHLFRRTELASVTASGSNWRDGTCVAQCQILNHMRRGSIARQMRRVGMRIQDHEPPSEGCSCGIYGTLGLLSLMRQYGLYAQDIVAVIAAEGVTIIGGTGLRTAAARVVAYWTPLRGYRKIARRQFEGAQHFQNLDEMLTAYGLSKQEQTVIRPPGRLNIFVWSIYALWCSLAASLNGNRLSSYLHDQQWGLAAIEAVPMAFLAALTWYYYRRVRARIG